MTQPAAMGNPLAFWEFFQDTDIVNFISRIIFKNNFMTYSIFYEEHTHLPQFNIHVFNYLFCVREWHMSLRHIYLRMYADVHEQACKYGDQRKISAVLLCRSPAQFTETWSWTEPGARLAANKLQKSAIAIPSILRLQGCDHTQIFTGAEN